MSLTTLMQRTLYFLLATTVLVLLLANFTPLRQEFPSTFPHWYLSDQGRFQALERTKGHDPVGSIRKSFETYKIEKGNPSLVLYRRFSKKWWQVWNWYYFMAAPCWDFPYAERDEDT